MRKRIQHPRKQRPSRVQIETQTGQLGTRYAARIDQRLMVDKQTGHPPWFDSATEAETEALWCLCCKTLDAQGWNGLQTIDLLGTIPLDDVVIDLFELGLLNDSFDLTETGRTMASLYRKRFDGNAQLY